MKPIQLKNLFYLEKITYTAKSILFEIDPAIHSILS